MLETQDCVVIGAGVIGLACARKLAMASRDVIVLEAESAIATHTSSRNSEVIHAGIYYPRNSLKARLCVAGRHALYRYCRERGVSHAQPGKLIVAVKPEERTKLDALQARAEANGVSDLRRTSASEIAELEPCVRAIDGLFSPSTGIVNSHELVLALLADLESAGSVVVCNSRVVSGVVRDDGIELAVEGEDAYRFCARTVVNAAGLWAPAVAAALSGFPRRKVPYGRYAKAHYYSYSGNSPFAHLVYPLPTDGGLGVHATLDLGGQVRFGPDVEWSDGVDYSFDDSRRSMFEEAIASWFPSLDRARLQPGYTGVRPKISGLGDAPADFSVQGPADHGVDGLVNLYGIESPGLTASLSLADLVCELLD